MRVNDRASTIVSVAVPIQRIRAVLGVLLLSTQGGDIDKIVAAERLAHPALLRRRGAGDVILSLLLASPSPIRCGGSRRGRTGAARRQSREEIPDFTDAHGRDRPSVGRALRDMTKALYNRIEAIESFAADVAHELKNPLTSLRSAVETLPLAKNDEFAQPADGRSSSTTCGGSTG